MLVLLVARKNVSAAATNCSCFGPRPPNTWEAVDAGVDTACKSRAEPGAWDAKCSVKLRVWMYFGQLPKAWSTFSSSDASEGGSRSVPLTRLRRRLVSSRPKQPSLLPGWRLMGSEVSASGRAGGRAGRQSGTHSVPESARVSVFLW